MQSFYRIEERASMIIRFPKYFSQFTCMASECPDTCCQGWEIQVDQKTLKRYRAETGILKNKLKRWINFRTGSLQFQNGICPFLEQGLCSLQKEKGEEMLCRTCRRYPRHVEEYGNRREYSLSLSCPATAALLLKQEEPIRFIEKEFPGMGRPEEEVEPLFLATLLDIRRSAVRISQNRELTIAQRMSAVLAMCHDLQARLGVFGNRPRLSEVPKILGNYEFAIKEKNVRLLNKLEQCCLEERERQKKYSLLFDVLLELEPAESHWNKYCRRILQGIRRDEERRGPRQTEQWTENYEHIFVTYLDLYLPGAVYDDDVLTKAKLAVFHCLMLRGMEACLEEELLEFFHIYGRETEHSQTNIEYLEKRLSSEFCIGLRDMIACVMPPKGKMKEKIGFDEAK